MEEVIYLRWRRLRLLRQKERFLPLASLHFLALLHAERVLPRHLDGLGASSARTLCGFT